MESSAGNNTNFVTIKSGQNEKSSGCIAPFDYACARTAHYSLSIIPITPLDDVQRLAHVSGRVSRHRPCI